MSDLLMLLVFFLFDFSLSIAGWNLYTLLLFAPYLFIRNYSSGTILFAGGSAVLLSELIHQHTLGSLALGVGIALFVFHWFLDVINWYHLLPQASCLVVYFLIIVSVRSLLYWFTMGVWSVPPLSSLLMTYIVGFLMLAYRFNRLSRSSRGPSGNDAV
jgi:hypothetical protein